MMKDKNPPAMKNGAKGMYFCLFLCAHIAPPMQAIISAIDSPVVPSHKPPMLINLMSPIPIGVVFVFPCFRNRWSYIIPSADVKI